MIFGQGTFINEADATPEQVAKKREAIAAMMSQQGRASSAAEGWVDLATGIINGISEYKLSKMEQDRRAGATEAFKAETDKMDAWKTSWNPFGGGNISTSGTQTHGADGAFGDTYGARNAAMEATGGPTRAAADQLSGRDRELLARTLMAEAGGEGLQGMLAAGSVINNRLNAGGYGDSLEGVIMKPGQFSAWNGVTGYAGGEGGLDMANMTPSEQAYQAADAILSGQYEDPTGGATHYYNPAAANPAWGVQGGGDWTRIGNHVFGSADAGRGTGPGTISTQGGAVQGMPAYTGPSVQELAGLLANPWMTPQQQASIRIMMDEAQKATDPMRQLQLQEAQLRLERARNPQTVRTLSSEEATGMGLPAGGVYQMKPDGSITTAAAAPKAGAGGNEFGLTPQYITDAAGNLKMVQLGKDGSINEVKLPEGSAIQKGVEKLDLGTAFQWYNTITGEPIGNPIAKNNEQAAADTARGTATGKADAEAMQAAPQVIARADEGIRLIDQILNDPELPSILGNVQGRIDPEGFSGLFMSQDAINLATKEKQLRGQTFMQAFDSLKGGGQITEKEGEAATQSIANLSRLQDEKAYAASLGYLRQLLENAKARANGRAGPEYLPRGDRAPAQAGGGETRVRHNP
uniref:cell wall hydrolase n=1 Tax=Celeribacter sp. TaxID=1890673 RepID=UPI003A946358